MLLLVTCHVFGVRFLHWKVTFSPIFRLAHLESPSVSSTLGSRWLCFPPWRPASRWGFGIFHHGSIAYPLRLWMHSVTYSHQRGLRYVYFKLGVTIQNYLIYFVAKMVPVLDVDSTIGEFLGRFDIPQQCEHGCVCTPMHTVWVSGYVWGGVHVRLHVNVCACVCISVCVWCVCMRVGMGGMWGCVCVRVCICWPPFFLALQDALGSSCLFPSQTSPFPKEPWLLWLASDT